jgi:small subunit ribosomal protein S18
MARGGGDRGDRRRTPKDTGRRNAKKKVCVFCSDHIKWVDYKDVNLLRRFMSDRGKIRARRVSGNCAQHQRDVAVAIKTARELALLPYSQRTVAERGGGRGRGSREDRDMGPRPPRDVVPSDDGDGEVDADLVIVGGEGPGRAEPPAAEEISAEVADVAVEDNE